MSGKNLIINSIFVFSLLASCSKPQNSNCQNNDLIVKLNASIKIRDDVRLIIEECLNKYPQYNSFILSHSPERLVKTEVDDAPSNDFLIGPAFVQSDNDKTPLLYFDFKGRKIFIKCGLEELYKDSYSQDSIYRSQLIKRGSDSIVGPFNIVYKDGALLYIHRSIHFKINKDGSLSKNYRPDTLFLPKLLPSTVRFDSSIK